MKTITVQELKQKIANHEDFKLLDVREPSEFAEANMGGHLLPLGQIANMQLDDIEDWRNQEVIVHCRSGMRSLQACMILEQAGFTNVANLQGGIMEWLQQQ